MNEHAFETTGGRPVTAVTAEEMRAVDRVTIEDVGVDLLQMMENAGRTLAGTLREARNSTERVVVLAGNGGNGGGGLAAARHLANHRIPVEVVLDRDPERLDGAVAHQHGILEEMGVTIGVGPRSLPAQCGVVADAVIGYGLTGAVRGAPRELVGWTDGVSAPVVSLDVPTGIDATTGEVPGEAVEPTRILTLALPKTGLAETAGDLELADISVPAAVYDRLDVPYEPPFGPQYRVGLRHVSKTD